MSTTTINDAASRVETGERSFPSASSLFRGMAKGATRAFEHMIAARERQAMIAVRRYAELYDVDLDVVKAEMARTMGSDEHTPRNAPRAGKTKASERVTRF